MEEYYANTVIVQTKDGIKTLNADTVIIISAGMKSRRDIANEFYGIVQDTNIIGDANRPATVAEATHDGYYVSASL